MISRLQKRFVLANMAFVTIILIIVFSSVFTASYRNFKQDTSLALEKMYESTFREDTASDNMQKRRGESRNNIQPPNGGEVPPNGGEAPPEGGEAPPEGGGTPPENGGTPPEDGGTPPDGGEAQPDEGAPKEKENAPTRTPMFALVLNEDGTAELRASENITVDDELISEAAAAVTNTDDENGIIRDLNLRYLKRGSHVVFADTTNETSTLRSLIFISLFVGVCGLAAFFLVSLFLAKMVVKPVKTAWDNQKRFVADASHELKTPITVILANMNILRGECGAEDDARKWVDSTTDEAEHMRVLVEDMLFLAKNDSGGTNFTPAPLNLSELVEGCILQFEPVAFENGLVINEDIDGGISVFGGKKELRQLVAILLDNACKYADRNSEIKISLKREQNSAVLRVNDFGTIIEKEDAEHIFERFYRADKSRVRKEGGYGLGLSIAYSIVEMHKGKISVKSGRESGTTFTVRLPLMK